MRAALFPSVTGLCLAAALAASACNGNTSASRTEDHAPAVATRSVSVRPTVAWPAASSVDEGALRALSSDGTRTEDELRALVARSPVPVLVPKALRLTTPTLIVEGEFFALTGRADGATLSLQGTRAAHRYEGIGPVAGNRDVRGELHLRGFVSVNEGIRTASWMENGVAYSLDVECSDARDARCQSDDFLLSVLAELTFVGGSGR